jgi:serine/threonine protein kinase
MLLILERSEKFKAKFTKYFQKVGLNPQCYPSVAALSDQLQMMGPPKGILVNLHGQTQLEAIAQLRLIAHQRKIPLAFLFSPQSRRLAENLQKGATRETYFELPSKLSKIAQFFQNPQIAFDALLGEEIGPEGLKVKLLRKLGAGAMGAVYEACQNNLDRRVAVKFLKLDYLDNDSDAMLRFRNEAKAVAQLRSDHILQIYFTGFHNGQAYSVMEYIDGSPLDRHMRKEKALKPAHAMKLAVEILKGLKEAHDHGIIHRDIKPANVMLNSRGQAVILDFGLVRSHNNPVMTQTNALLGTPRYMAPEQISGQQIDHRADLYALGIMLYEMLVGKPPYQGNDIVSLLMKHIHEPLPDPATMGVIVDERIFNFINQLCVKDREQRIQSAHEGLAKAEKLLADIKNVDGTATLVLGEGRKKIFSGDHANSDKLFLDSGEINSHDSYDAENQSIDAQSGIPSLHSVSNISLGGKTVPSETIDLLLDLFTEYLGPLARRLAVKKAKTWDLDLGSVPAKKWSTLLNGLGEMIENPTKQEDFLDRAVLLKKSF